MSHSSFRLRDPCRRHFVSTITIAQQWFVLHSVIAPEECASCSLSKDEPEGKHKVSDEEWKLKNAEDGDQMSASDTVKDKDSNVAGGDDANRGNAILMRMSEYERTREKNIAQLKLELSKLKEQYLLPDAFQWKLVAKKSTKKKDKVQGKEGIRRQSLRNQPKWVFLWLLWQ